MPSSRCSRRLSGGEFPLDKGSEEMGESIHPMIVSCTSCGAKYRYDEARFEGKPSKKIRCTKCQTIFEVTNPAAEAAVAPPPARPDNPSPLVGSDMTYTRKPSDGLAHEDRTKEYIVPPAKDRPQRSTANLRLPTGKRFSLAAISGTDAGKTFPVVKPRMVIGRTGADVNLSDAEISRNHAAVEFEEETVTLVDLGSTNGTFVDGQRIDTAPLSNYGEFEIGGTTLMLIVTDGQ